MRLDIQPSFSADWARRVSGRVDPCGVSNIGLWVLGEFRGEAECGVGVGREGLLVDIVPVGLHVHLDDLSSLAAQVEHVLKRDLVRPFVIGLSSENSVVEHRLQQTRVLSGQRSVHVAGDLEVDVVVVKVSLRVQFGSLWQS